VCVIIKRSPVITNDGNIMLCNNHNDNVTLLYKSPDDSRLVVFFTGSGMIKQKLYNYA